MEKLDEKGRAVLHVAIPWPLMHRLMALMDAIGARGPVTPTMSQTVRAIVERGLDAMEPENAAPSEKGGEA